MLIVYTAESIPTRREKNPVNRLFTQGLTLAIQERSESIVKRRFPYRKVIRRQMARTEEHKKLMRNDGIVPRGFVRGPPGQDCKLDLQKAV